MTHLSGPAHPIVYATATKRRARRVNRLVLIALVLTAVLAFMPSPSAADEPGTSGKALQRVAR